MKTPGIDNEAAENGNELIPSVDTNIPFKKEPDEDRPSLIDSAPDQLKVPPSEEKDNDLNHILSDKELLEEKGKVDDGLI